VIGGNRLARWNRGLLGLTGLILLGAGGFALAAHCGRLDWVRPGSPLVTATAAPPLWVQWVVVGVAGVLGLACLRWAAAQVVRAPRQPRWRGHPVDPPGTTVVDAAVAADAVAADVAGYTGVRAAQAWLTGSGITPRLYVAVTAGPDLDTAELRRRLRTHAVPRLRQALEVDTIPVTLEVRLGERG
jgi:hypothetical protein